jgi:hypothetical protein
VLPSNPIATAAAITVNGAAIPAAVTIVANPKKKRDSSSFGGDSGGVRSGQSLI